MLYVGPYVAWVYQRILIVLIQFAARAYRVVYPAGIIDVPFHMVAALRPPGYPHSLDIEVVAPALAVDKDIVMLT